MLTGNQGTTLLDAVRGWTPASGHWPTPDAAVSNDGEEPETFLARKERHATKTDAEPTRAGVPLALAVKWATPRATEGEKGGPNGRDGSGSLHLAAQSAAWPTPNASDDKGASTRTEGRERPPADDDLPTRIARSASGLVLNPVFVEALMGWPLGWTDPTSPAGGAVPFPPPPNGDWATYLQKYPGTEPAVAKGEPLRTDRLRACGNGVVPAQAAAAFRELFDALGVANAHEALVAAMQRDEARRERDEARRERDEALSRVAAEAGKDLAAWAADLDAAEAAHARLVAERDEARAEVERLRAARPAANRKRLNFPLPDSGDVEGFDVAEEALGLLESARRPPERLD